MFESMAYAVETTSRPQAAAPNPLLSFMPMILILGIFYFLLIRPQQKRQQEVQKLIDNLKKGDRVVTAGGIIGTVMSVQSDYLVVKVGDGDTKLEILKSAVTGLRQERGKTE